MKKFIVGLLMFGAVSMFAASDNFISHDSNILVTKASNKSFEKTYSALISFLKKQKIDIFAEFDHGDNAKKVKLELAKSKVVVFGNPKVGTFLMQDNIDMSIMLPLKIAVVEKDGKAYVSYIDMGFLKDKFSLKNDKVIGNITTLLDKITTEITK